jgi:hypothetical protein
MKFFSKGKKKDGKKEKKHKGKKSERREEVVQDEGVLARAGLLVDNLVDKISRKFGSPSSDSSVPAVAPASASASNRPGLRKAFIALIESFGDSVDRILDHAIDVYTGAEAELEIYTLTRVLDEQIYNKPTMRSYAEKASTIGALKILFNRIDNIDTLVALYDYINLPAHKDKLNIHRDLLKDRILLNDNTDSWIDLLDTFRKHAFKVLLARVGITEAQWEHIYEGEDPIPAIEDPRGVHNLLIQYVNLPLFSKHHSNMNLANLVHDTRTRGKIDTLITYCRRKHEQGLRH